MYWNVCWQGCAVVVNVPLDVDDALGDDAREEDQIVAKEAGALQLLAQNHVQDVNWRNVAKRMLQSKWRARRGRRGRGK